MPGRTKVAIGEFEAALRLKPDFAQAHYCLAIVLLREPGRRAESKEHLEQALKLRPDFEPARKALERLGRAGP